MSDGIDPASLVKDLRARAGLSQRALARRAGTAQSVVARIELGETSPTTTTLNRLLRAAGQALELRLRPRSSSDAPDTLLGRLASFFEEGSVPGLVSAYVFGSTARRARHEESDVDVAVLLDRALHPSAEERGELRVRLGADLVATLGTNEVDLVILNDLPPGFARKIVLDGSRLACPCPDLDHAFRRNVQLRCADLAPFLRRAARVKLEALAR